MHRPFARGWLLPAGLIALVAAHVMGLYHLTSRVELSAVVVSAAVALVVVKHLGLFGTLYSAYRRRRHRDPGP